MINPSRRTFVPLRPLDKGWVVWYNDAKEVTVMSDKTTDHRHPGGRPIEGYENKGCRVTVRLERFIYEELVRRCKALGIKPSDAIREGVRLFLREYDMNRKRKD